MLKKIIQTPQAPEPIGPYSQATEMHNMIFLSGQIAIIPASGQMMINGDIQSETRQVMENIKAILTAAGCSMAHIVKSSIFILDMGKFNEINAVYAEYFTTDAPARETVQVSALPKNAQVEISVIAMR